MEVKIVHFYPDLMNLYGSYANVAVLKRRLEAMGNTVIVETITPWLNTGPLRADFIFMGAGTERAQKAALTDFLRFEDPIKISAESGAVILFAGTAMELLGKTITDSSGKVNAGIGLGSFSSIQKKERFVEDVFARTTLFPEPVVGFMNKCSIISGVTTPLLTGMAMGYGNDGPRTPEGFFYNNVIASHLTGPILVKNPRLLDYVVTAIYRRQNEPVPSEFPQDPWAEAAYLVAAEQLKQRAQELVKSAEAGKGKSAGKGDAKKK